MSGGQAVYSDPGAEFGAEPAAMAVEDALLGGRVRLVQPAQGYRAAIDPVLLAAATHGGHGVRVLDVGTGTGAAALCLAARDPGVRVVALEKHREIGAYASHNVELNGLQGRVLPVIGDLLRPPPMLAPGSFDRVMMNPPYLKADAATAPPGAWKAAANVEGEARLAEWIAFAAAMLKTRGILTLVHRADRIDEILALLHGRFGGVTLFPLWPKAGEAAKRVLLSAHRNAKGPAKLAAGLTLHAPDGRYTQEAEAVLRDGAALVL
ncbi:tRNA1(Val) (adenine(37)-N6)-methyltransferase [Azospirillum sp.]|uniref:tRNA1(Val) (adenine(37)-N6)-methyltransferase n=1 Tax=Azospirillum sp. TaxID=34012 RepID=UPI002D3E5C22|nr:methyltransferase [Azospirillum sp.]HYD67692.1 methyltransferase [Azospirillum sp.]